MVIDKVLDTLAQKLQDTPSAGALDVEFFRKLVAFSNAVDKCHHSKEEGCLFPCLTGKGMPREGGPIGMMLMEHEMGRALIRQLSETLDLYENGDASVDDVVSPCREYLQLLKQHISKENGVLYPMGENMMSEQDDAETLTCYEDGEQEMGPEASEDLIRLAAEMNAEI
mgnify:FL=1|jgi:hemerythrin-like domain-containing protein|tara:strand:+ start:2191 stop:2697 length:507 start_codon:yes stop_codon:yes gene_type:complete